LHNVHKKRHVFSLVVGSGSDSSVSIARISRSGLALILLSFHLMIKQKFVSLFPGLACALLCLAALPAAADDYIADDPIGVDNQLYTLAFNQQSVSRPYSLDIIGTDLSTGNTQRIPGFTLAERYQSLAGLTALPDGTFASSSDYGSTAYLYLFGATKRTLRISGLPTQSAYITALVGLNNGTLLASINPNRRNGFSPFSLETINLQSGAVTETGFPFPGNRSFSGLTQCPDGSIYALASAPNYSSYSKSLVRLDLRQQQVVYGPTLIQSGQPPINPLSLACSPQGALFVEGVPNANANAGEGSFLPPALFGVNQDSGELATVHQPFNYAGGITFVPAKIVLEK